MNVQEQIERALLAIYEPGEITAGQVYRGFDYDDVRQATGWWFRPFGQTPIYLGANADEALDTIEAIADERMAERDTVPMTVSEMAGLTGIPVQTLYSGLQSGRVVGRKSCGTWLVTVAAVRAAQDAGQLRR